MSKEANGTDGALEAYLTAGKRAGCASDQMGNFVRAGVALQPEYLAEVIYPSAVRAAGGDVACDAA